MSNFLFYYFVCGFIAMCYDYITSGNKKLDIIDYFIRFTILIGGYISFYFMVRDIMQHRWWDK